MLGTSVRAACRRWYSSGAGAKRDLRFGPKEHGCGIPPWDPRTEPEPVKSKPLPDQLVRPPCYPGQTRGDFQTCVSGEEGVYCTPCRIKYKYPAFSENIDFVPMDSHPACWWRSQETCLYTENTDEMVKSMTKKFACALDAAGRAAP